MRRTMRRLGGRAPRGARWLAVTTAQSWALQLALFALLAASGVGGLTAAVAVAANAKLTAYAFWLGQLYEQAKGRDAAGVLEELS